MKKLLLHLLCFLGFVVTTNSIFAQNPSGGRLTQPDRLNTLARQNEQVFQQRYRKALRLARRYRWVIEESGADGTYLALQGVTENNQPIYFITDNNTRAAATTRTNQLWTGGTLGLRLNGSNPVLSGKMGIWDGGRVFNTHQELVGRVTQRDEGSTTDPGTGVSHATHVAGTMMASGVVPIARGMAYGFNDLQAYNFSNDIAEMAAAASNLLISNHSYGEVAGWRLNPARSGNAQWEWNGDSNISDTEDYRFGFYSNDARRWDEICFNAPYYLPVKSAGNNRNQTGPAVGQPYWRRNRDGNFERIDARPTSISSNNGYDIISTYGIAKNILTVGAVSALPGGANQPSDIQLASFSSWGPSDDGRIKPDLVANGVDVLSSTSNATDAYTSFNGTSMSTPNVAGSLLLLQEYYFQRSSTFMRAATLKGLAIHTADEAGEATGPDYRFGWGLLNTERAAQVIGAGTDHQITERALAQGQTHEITVVASGRAPLAVTLAWTDPPAVARTASRANLNNRTPLLVNDLDIRIREGNTEFLPWVLDPANPVRAATRGDNICDNVENIRIDNPVPGKTYTVRVTHKGSLRNGNQAYSLIVSGIGGPSYCTSQPRSGNDGRIEAVSFGDIRNTSASGCATYSDFTQTAATRLSAGQVIPLRITVGSCGNSISQIVKTYADWNNDGDFTDAGELLATSGVLNGLASFEASIAIPAGLNIGYTTRLRVVSVATTNPDEVQPCGTYDRGETEDYVLHLIRPAIDAGVSALLTPEPDFCAGNQHTVSVRIKNFGEVPQQNIPVRVVVTAGSTVLTTIRGILAESIPAFGERILKLSGEFTALSGKEYTFTVTTELPGDQDPTNDQLAVNRRVAAEWLPLANAVICEDQVHLSAGNASGTAFWYDSPTGNRLIAVGNSIFSPVKTPDNTYYVSLNNFSGAVGPARKQVFTGGSYAGNFGPEPLLTTYVPLVIEKARLYTGNPGRITFTVYTYNGIPVSSTTLNVAATRNAGTPAGSVAGQLADDPNDEGRVYDLNLTIPEPGRYKIRISYEDGASIYRSNQGVNGYPYVLPNIMQITGAAFNSDTLRNAYYYLYDLRVKSLGCPGPRVAVKARASGGVPPTATIRSSGNVCVGQQATLTLELTGTPPWNLSYTVDGQPRAINFIAASPYTFTTPVPGTFRITRVGDATHCPVTQTTAPAIVAFHPPPDVSLDASGFRLTAGQGTNYRWFLNEILIDMARGRTLIARRVGRYNVEVTSANGCQGRSLSVMVNEADTNDQLTGGWLTIGPNPTTERLNVYLGQSHRVVQVQLLNTLGQVLRRIAVNPLNNESLDLSMETYAAGTYMLILEGADMQQTHRIIKL